MEFAQWNDSLHLYKNSRPSFELWSHSPLGFGRVVGLQKGPVLTRPHVITRRCPQAWGAAYSLIRPRSFQKQLRFPPESNIKVIYDSFFEHQVLHLWQRIEFLITIWVDVFINGLPDHRINIMVFKNAGVLIVFRLNLSAYWMGKMWRFCTT